MSKATQNTPYEGRNLANRNNKELGAFDRKLKSSHTLFGDILIRIRD